MAPTMANLLVRASGATAFLCLAVWLTGAPAHLALMLIGAGALILTLAKESRP